MRGHDQGSFVRAVRLNVHSGVALAVLATAGLMPTSAAFAQEPSTTNEASSGQGLQEITVTARRREERLETVPFAVSALGAGRLEAQDVRSLVDVSRNVPGFQFQNQTGGGSGRNDRSTNNLVFRGLALGNVSPISQGGLVFIDGAPVIQAAVPPQDDTQRVEVLKGPQSVYFGRSTFSGAVNFVTKDPSFDFGGRVRAAYGNYGSNQASLSLNVPIVKDLLALRLSGSHDDRGAQYRNAAQPDQKFGRQKTDAVSAQLLLKTDSLRIKGFASYGRQNDGPPAQASLKKGQFNCNLGGTYGAYYCGALPNRLDPSLISANYFLSPLARRALFDNPGNYPLAFDPHFNQHAGLKRDIYQGDVRIDYTFASEMTVSSITAAHSDKVQTILDLVFRDARNIVNVNAAAIPTAPPNPQWLLSAQTKVTDFSQELRLTSKQEGRFRWTFGGSYFKASYTGGVVYGLSPFGFANSSTPFIIRPKTPAVFAAVYIDPVPELTVSIEGRYQWDKVKQQVIGTSTGIRLTTPFALAKTYKSFSPRISLDYKITPTSIVYALFSRGYRPGGFNGALAVLNPSSGVLGNNGLVYNQLITNGGGDAYDQEKLDNFEAGIKSRFLNNKASVRFSAYYDIYKNGQVANTIPFYPCGNSSLCTVNLLSVIQNIGKVDLKGIELEGDLAPMKGLTINGSFGIADSKIKRFVCQECLYIKGTTAGAIGNRLSAAPKWTWTLGTEYETPISDDWKAYGRVDYRHRGHQFVDLANVAYSRNDDQVDLRFGLRKTNFSLEAFAQNLFNEQTLVGFQGSDLLSLSGIPGYTTTGTLSELRTALPEKRRLGVRASFDF